MSLLHRRMMMAMEVAKELFNINTARTSTDSWRGIEYTIKDGALTITNGKYTWSPVNVYLDNCIKGKTYQLTFSMKTEREKYPTCQISIDGKNISAKEQSPATITFTCGDEVPIFKAFWSTTTPETLPITYYDFILEEI